MPKRLTSKLLFIHLFEREFEVEVSKLRPFFCQFLTEANTIFLVLFPSLTSYLSMVRPKSPTILMIYFRFLTGITENQFSICVENYLVK